MSPRNPVKISTVEDIQKMAEGYRASRILLTAYDLEVFTVLGGNVMTSEEVASKVGADARGANRLLNALVALGLLEKDVDGFRNSSLSARYLVSGSEDYLGALGHQSNLYRRWSTLTEAVKAGGSVMEHHQRSHKETEAFIEAMHSRARNSADKLISKIDLDGVRQILDVGGGSGVFSMAFCRAKEGLTAVVLDVPQVTPQTRVYAAANGFGHRISTREGDFNLVDFGTENFDLVFCSAIIHINSPAENLSLVKRAAKALRPGGRIVIQDFIMSDDRLSPPFGAIFALNMLVNTPGGDTYTESEIRSWMDQAGLKNFQRLDDDPLTTVVIGTKG